MVDWGTITGTCTADTTSVVNWSIGGGILEMLVGQIEYKPGWRFEISSGGAAGPVRFLVVHVRTEDSYAADFKTFVHHMPIPDLDLDGYGWQRWLLSQILLIEQHEACEFLIIGGHRPFAPHHFGSGDPYIIRETPGGSLLRTGD